MSTEAVHLVKKRQVGSTTRKAILFVLADYADAQWSSWASQKTIAAEAEVGERTVRRVLAEMEEDGLLKRERRHTVLGHRTSDRLTLVKSELEALPASLATRDEDDLPVTVAARDDEPTGHSDRSYRPTTTSLPATVTGPTGQSLAGESLVNRQIEPSENHLALPSRDELWDTISSIYGKPSPAQRPLQGKFVSFLTEEEATPDDIRQRSGWLIEKWGPEAGTMASLFKHWHFLASPAGRMNENTVEEYHAEMQRERRRRELAELDAEVKGIER